MNFRVTIHGRKLICHGLANMSEKVQSLVSLGHLLRWHRVSKHIYCDKENAEIEYTVNINDPAFFTAEFILALSFRLASYIAPRLTGGDPFKMKSEMISQYEIEIARAKKQALNEENKEKQPESEFIRTRS